MNRFDIDWSVPLLVKCRITCLRVTVRDLDFFIFFFKSERIARLSEHPQVRGESCWITFFDDFVGWGAHQTVFRF